MRSPIKWFGGKGNFVKKLLPLVPKHKTYVEPFGGIGSLLFAKEPSPIEVYNFCRGNLNNSKSKVIRAYRFFVVARMSFGGRFGSGFGTSITFSRRGIAGSVSAYLSAIENLPEVCSRLKVVQIENQDFRNILRCYDAKNTFFYLDPPYVSSTRKSGKYSHELNDQDHEELVELLLGLKGKALLSCYYSKIYKPLLKHGWKRKDWETACYSAGKTKDTGILGKGSAKKTQPRTETVLFNYKVNEHQLFLRK